MSFYSLKNATYRERFIYDKQKNKIIVHSTCYKSIKNQHYYLQFHQLITENIHITNLSKPLPFPANIGLHGRNAYFQKIHDGPITATDEPTSAPNA